MMFRADGVLFDKDGTLFHYAGMWNAWTARLINSLSQGDADVAQQLAEAVRFDLETVTFFPDSPVIAGTNRQTAQRFAPILPHWDVDALEAHISVAAESAALPEAVPLVPFLAQLSAFGLSLGVMTNDSESTARAHLRIAGVEGMFDFVAGADSGFGAKPDPDPLLAFAVRENLPPERIVMVGDSTHDLIAGRAAGMQTFGVLTGLAEADTLAPYADAVFPDIGHLSDWLRG